MPTGTISLRCRITLCDKQILNGYSLVIFLIRCCWLRGVELENRICPICQYALSFRLVLWTTSTSSLKIYAYREPDIISSLLNTPRKARVCVNLCFFAWDFDLFLTQSLLYQKIMTELPLLLWWWQSPSLFTFIILNILADSFNIL